MDFASDRLGFMRNSRAKLAFRPREAPLRLTGVYSFPNRILERFRQRVRVHVTIVVNGERRGPESLTVAGLLRHLGVKPEFVAVEVNRDLVPRTGMTDPARSGDAVEVVTLVGGGSPRRRTSTDRHRHARVPEPPVRRHRQVRHLRTDARLPGRQRVRGHHRRRPPRAADRQRGPEPARLPRPERYTILPNTAGCFTAEDAIRTPGWAASCSRTWTTPGPTG